MNIKFTDPAINYYVEDVETAVRFYVEHFGFVETFRTPKQGKPMHVEVTLGSFILGLAAKEAGMSMHGLPLGSGGFPRAELVIWTDDVDMAYTALIEKGVPSVSAPHNFLSSLRAAWVMDPDGNPVEIVSRHAHTKILIFTEGTIFTHRNWIGLEREEIVRRVKEGERPGYAGTMPIGEAAKKIQTWAQAGAEIVYLTSRRKPDVLEQVHAALVQFGFPAGELLFCKEGEEYKDVAERVIPDVIVEDDCESIGGEIEMTYPRIKPELKARIKSIVVREFGGIDHLSDNVVDLNER